MNITMSRRQQSNLEDAKQWITNNIRYVRKCIFTATSITDNQLCDGAILAIAVDCGDEDLIPFKHKVYEYNAKRNFKDIMLRIVPAGREDCFTDLIGGVEL